MTRLLVAVTLALGVGLNAVSCATAQSYPTRTVTLVNPLAAGGTGDVLCRLVADKLRAVLGQQVIVENRTGAGGNLGAQSVARADPDGHVLLCAAEHIFSNQAPSRQNLLTPIEKSPERRAAVSAGSASHP